MKPSLNEQLAALRAKKDAARDPAVTAVLNEAMEDLRVSGVLDRVKKVGDVAPLFARPNLEGRVVRSTSLLRRGPLVLSFFRGRW